MLWVDWPVAPWMEEKEKKLDSEALPHGPPQTLRSKTGKGGERVAE